MDAQTRIARLATILSTIQDIPQTWTQPKSDTSKQTVTHNPVDLLPCESYEKLQKAWEKALKWTDGLEITLSTMLASVMSTMAVGDQLWIKVIGPASCLDGDTPIYDPVDGSTKSVRERTEDGKKFFVLSKMNDGQVGIAQALPPVRSDRKEPLYDVKFRSGRSIQVTAGHRFWKGSNYVTIDNINTVFQEYTFYRLPSIWDVDLLPTQGCISPSTIVPVQHQSDPYYRIVTCRERFGHVASLDDVVEVNLVKEDFYYDFHVPETNNYWACGVFNHNCGKSTLCEALSTNKRYIRPVSVFRGFHSGFRKDNEDDEEDNALLSEVSGMTLVIKDGDTLLQSPNLPQILAEGRDVYDGVSRSHYRTGTGKNYEGLRMSFLLCGTASLRSIDSSELGERFLDCVVMDTIDDDLEDEILSQVAARASRNMSLEVNDQLETHHDPDLMHAMRLTGGYIDHLRGQANKILTSIQLSDDALRKFASYGKFVAHMRARPSRRQNEDHQRELGARLTSQHARLGIATAGVMNQTKITPEVLRRVRKVCLDTSRGVTFRIVSAIYKYQTKGLELRGIGREISETDDYIRPYVRFLSKIDVLERFIGPSNSERYRLTEKLYKLYRLVVLNRSR